MGFYVGAKWHKGKEYVSQLPTARMPGVSLIVPLLTIIYQVLLTV